MKSNPSPKCAKFPNEFPGGVDNRIRLFQAEKTSQHIGLVSKKNDLTRILILVVKSATNLVHQRQVQCLRLTQLNSVDARKNRAAADGIVLVSTIEF